jgi:hypothetical protein
VETVYSVSCDLPRGGLVFDFVVDRDLAGWWRHEFSDGGFDGAGPCSTRDVCAAVGEATPRAVVEMRCAAATLEETAAALLEAAEQAAFTGDLRTAGLLARRSGEVQRARTEALGEVVRACDAAWDDAIARVERARGEPDDEELHGALRTVELLWTSRLAVRRLLAR